MKKSDEARKNAQINEIYNAFYQLKAKNVVKSQKDFAQVLGISQQTLSAALHDRGRFMNDTLYHNAVDALRSYDVEIKDISEIENLSAGGDIVIEDKSQKILPEPSESTSHLLDLLKEKDAQINRLLTLLENEQNARKAQQ